MEDNWDYAKDNSSLKYNYMEDNLEYVPGYTNNESSSSSYTNNDAEYNFATAVYNLLNEYSLAVNHMNTYHNEGWIYNNPEDVALEVTYLAKVKELANKLRSFSYPESLTGWRNNLVKIADDICIYKEAQINSMKNNDWNGNVQYHGLYSSSHSALYNTYNNMIK